MKKLKVTGNNTTQHIYIKGDKDAETEPLEFWIYFPGGQIGVSRCADDTYWAHLSLEDEKEDFDGREKKSEVIDARIDCDGLNGGEANVGDLRHPNFNHIAIKIKLTQHK